MAWRAGTTSTSKMVTVLKDRKKQGPIFPRSGTMYVQISWKDSMFDRMTFPILKLISISKGTTSSGGSTQ